MKVLITSYKPSKEGVVFILSDKTSLKTGNVKNNEFYVSWDKIGSLLFDNYLEGQSVDEANDIRSKDPIQEAEHKQGVTMSSKPNKILDKSDIQKQVFSILSRHNVPNLMVISNDIADSLSLPLKEEQKSVTDDKYGYLMKSNDEHFFVMGKNMNHAIEIIEEHTKSGWEFEAHKSIVVLRSLFGEKGKEESK